MTDIPRAPAIEGATIRFIWTEGPTKGLVHEHVFHPDGTVEWRDPNGASTAKPAEPAAAPKRPRYGAFEVSKDVCLVSYLAPSGFTLTVGLNFATQVIVGFASSQDQWHPVKGTFEVVS